GRRHRHASAAHESRHRNRLGRGRRTAVGDPRPGTQWCGVAHGGARGGDRRSRLIRPDPMRPRVLLVGDGGGIAALVSLAAGMRAQPGNAWKPLVLLGSETPFAFKPRPSTILVPGIPAGVIAAVPELDSCGVPSRLASKAELPGCYDGCVAQLAD